MVSIVTIYWPAGQPWVSIVVIVLPVASDVCTCTPADSVGETLAGRIVPGAPAVLTRWSRDWRMSGVLAE